ncbi:MAG: cupin domain-containing protein [Proteobacteria bacterium]|nr:cupin domain-containing protein [Pseudomonadota bacterium]
MKAADIIKALAMQPHPEGGWYTETFRDEHGGERGHSTAIYYLLEAGDRSHWHRVLDAAEVWHYYAGAPLLLSLSQTGTGITEITLGPDVIAGERPQGVVPAGWWQSARSTGAFTLVGCTVAPGFTFSTFEMAEAGWSPAA